MSWQPIATAPKGEWVRLKFGDDVEDEHGPYVGILHPDAGAVWWDRMGTDYGYGAAHPTHWMPEHPDA